MPSPFVGVYKVVSRENYAAYFAAVGGTETIFSHKGTFTLEFFEAGDELYQSLKYAADDGESLSLSQPVKTELQDTKTLDGQRATFAFTVAGNTLTEVQTLLDRGNLTRTIVRVLDGNKLKVTFTSSGTDVVATEVLEKQ